MFRNYLTMALRIMRRHAVYTAINMAGLAIGMTCGVLILLYVQDELGYDRYHAQADRIYRIVNDADALVPYALAPMAHREMPEVTQYARLAPSGVWMMQSGSNSFYEEQVYWAEHTLFDVFSFPLVQGDPNTALQTPFSVVLNEATARKYFGDADPIGQTIRADDSWDLTVTGVMRDMPAASHFHADFLVSLTTLERVRRPDLLTSWVYTCYAYIVLAPEAAPEAVEPKLTGIVAQHGGQALRVAGMTVTPALQALTDIHLRSHLQHEMEPNSDISQIYILISIAVIILLIACINATNLATARSTSRAPEVGLRKVVGASRRQLMGQYSGESVLMALLALPLVMVFTSLALPVLNAITGKTLSLAYTENGLLSLGLLGIAVIVGLASGLYPAVILSSFRPVVTLKGAFGAGRSRTFFRKALVTVQFALSIVFIITTAIVYRQMAFVSARNLGFDTAQVIVVKVPIVPIQQRYEALKERALSIPGVIQVTRAYDVPGRTPPITTPVRVSGAPDDAVRPVRTMTGDVEFIETLGMEMLAGRSFYPEISADRQESVILNETAVHRFGWMSPDEAVGKRIEMGEFRDGSTVSEEIMVEKTVVGVVRDFHVESLHTPIEPVVLKTWNWADHFLFRIAPDRIAPTLDALQQTWADVFPAYPAFSYSFLDEDVDRLYRADEKLRLLLTAFAVLAVCIACLGLFGLATLTVEQRTREIGVRKVLGASVFQIVRMLSRDLVKLAVFANIVALPLAYLVANMWLRTFAYRIEPGPGVFLGGGAVVLVIALTTVSYHAVKAALANPVDALRYE